MTGESAYSKNAKRGFPTLHGNNPEMVDAGDWLRDILLTEVENHIRLLGVAQRTEEYREAVACWKVLKTKSSARWWVERRGMSAEALLKEQGGVR